MNALPEESIIIERLEKIQQKVGTNTTIIAVTKTFPVEIYDLCLKLGLRHIGENRVQELINKFSARPDSKNLFTVHLIGSLQTNKVKFLANNVDTLDSIDQIHLCHKIEERYKVESIEFKCLLQINSTAEDQKSGLSINDIDSITSIAQEINKSRHLKLEGLMTMGPTPTENFSMEHKAYRERTLQIFNDTAQLKVRLEQVLGQPLPRLSMGMSHDYMLAVEAGATEIRIGTGLFGPRQ